MYSHPDVHRQFVQHRHAQLARIAARPPLRWPWRRKNSSTGPSAGPTDPYQLAA